MAKYDVQYATPEMTPGTWIELREGSHLTFARAKQLVLDCLDDDSHRAHGLGQHELELALNRAYLVFKSCTWPDTVKPACVQGYRYRIVRDATSIEER